MGIEESDAWVLHKRPISDNSSYVTFFTKNKGILVALCRIRNKQVTLQQFTPLWLAFTEKLGKYYVNKIESKGVSLNFNKDSLFASLYLNELLYHLLKPEEECQLLYKTYEETLFELQNLSSKNLIEKILRLFELRLLQVIGYGFSLAIDIENAMQVQVDKYYKFMPDKGVVLAEQGILGKYLLAIDRHDFSDDNTLKITKKITRSAIEYCLDGKSLRSRDLYNM